MAERSFWQMAFTPKVSARAARVALIVGTVLIAINHGDKILTGGMTTGAWVKCMLTYLVPYAVSTYSSVMALREAAMREETP